MKLGTQFVHATEDWSAFRPYADDGRQLERPWSGDWNARTYPAVLRRDGELYRCAFSSNGRGAGTYICSSSSLQADEWELCGDVRKLADGTHEVGQGNVWLEITPARDYMVAEVRVSMFQTDAAADDATWKPDFLKAIEPFKAWRSMNFCGPGSRVAATMRSEGFGGFARGPLRWNDDSPEYGRFNAETGNDPQFWFPPGIKDGWINCPLLIALDPAQRAAWLLEAARWSEGCELVRVAVDNELENNDFPVARLAYSNGRVFLPSDPAVGRTLAVLLATKELKNTIALLRLDHRFVATFETLPRDYWPFSEFGGGYVSGMARDLLREIGRFATSPYAGREVTDLSQLGDSIRQEVDAMARWRDLLGTIGIEPDFMEAYEAGPWHFPRSAPSSWRFDSRVVDAVPEYLDAMAGIFGARSAFCLYGLCEDDKWGMLPKLGTTTALYDTVAQWAKAHSTA